MRPHRSAGAAQPHLRERRFFGLKPADNAMCLRRPRQPARTAFSPARSPGATRLFSPQPERRDGERDVERRRRRRRSGGGYGGPAGRHRCAGGLAPRFPDVRLRRRPAAAGDRSPDQRQQDVLETCARSMWRRRVRSTRGFMEREFSRRPPLRSRSSLPDPALRTWELLRLLGMPRRLPRPPRGRPASSNVATGSEAEPVVTTC